MTTRRLSLLRSPRQLSYGLALIAIACLFAADLDISSSQASHELLRMAQGLMAPHFWSLTAITHSVFTTLAFALQGLALAAVAGFALAMVYRFALVRAVCAFIRAIHELFWALIFIQLFGLSPLTGLLAIALPYAGTLAKIYGELFEEADAAPRENLLHRESLSAFLYTTLPLALKPLLQYTSYRFECAIRSSIILGFIGLPTLGYHLETALGNGQYNEAAALLYVLFAIVGSLRWWLKKALIPLYLIAACVYLPPTGQFNWAHILRFFSEDIIPAPLRHSAHFDFIALSNWLSLLWQQQIAPGLASTLVLSQIALFLTAVLSLCWFPLNSKHFFSPFKRSVGDGFLIISRTLPEYLLAFIGLLLLGPSMLPAILALAVHNGAIIAHLLGRFSSNMALRDDACHGSNRYFYEILPRVYRQFLALLLYRWEVIMRETAILGILGIGTLGFYIDSAFEEFRFDRAILLILCAALLNMAVDGLAHWLRKRMHLNATPETL